MLEEMNRIGGVEQQAAANSSADATRMQAGAMAAGGGLMSVSGMQAQRRASVTAAGSGEIDASVQGGLHNHVTVVREAVLNHVNGGGSGSGTGSQVLSLSSFQVGGDSSGSGTGDLPEGGKVTGDGELTFNFPIDLHGFSFYKFFS